MSKHLQYFIAHICFFTIAAYSAAVLFCLSEDSRKQASVPTGHSGNVRNDVSLLNSTCE